METERWQKQGRVVCTSCLCLTVERCVASARRRVRENTELPHCTSGNWTFPISSYIYPRPLSFPPPPRILHLASNKVKNQYLEEVVRKVQYDGLGISNHGGGKDIHVCRFLSILLMGRFLNQHNHTFLDDLYTSIHLHWPQLVGTGMEI